MMIVTLIIFTFMSWSCHSAVICVPFQFNSSCSVECGSGTIQSITKYLDDVRQECKPEETKTFPCEVNGCTTGQECSYGVCTPQWHWQQPNSEQSFKLVNLTNSPRDSHKVNYLFYTQNNWVKLQVYLLNLTVSWSNDGKVWDKVIQIDPPSDSNTYVSSFLDSFADADEDGKLYFLLYYVTKDFSHNAALYTIDKENITMVLLPQSEVTYNEIKALNGVLYIFFQNETERLSYFTYENGTFGQDFEIDNSIVFLFYSFEKGKDFIAVVGNSISDTMKVTISSFVIYQNRTFTQPIVITNVNQSTPMALKNKDDSWILVWASVNSPTIEISITKDLFNWRTDQFKTIPFTNVAGIDQIEVEVGSNGTILILATVIHFQNLYHSYDVYYSLSVDYGQNWSSLKQINNLEEISPVKTVSDRRISLATDMRGWWLSVWYQTQYEKNGLNEASSMFYVDTNCLDNINCYAFDGDYNYLPRDAKELPINLPPGNLWAVKSIIDMSNTTINGNFLSTAMRINYRGNTTIQITGNVTFTQFLNIELASSDSSLISTEKVLNINSNTTLTVTIPTNFNPTNLKLISFVEKSGTFSNVLINEKTCKHSIVQKNTVIELVPICDPTQHVSSSSALYVSIVLLVVFCSFNFWNSLN